MTQLKRLLTLRLRRKKRYQAKEGVYVEYDQSTSRNQVESLSMGGLSFYYVDNGMRIDKGSYELSLTDRNRIFLRKIPFKMVSDIEIGEVLFHKTRVKRQSVRFDNLTQTQKRRLGAIIANYTN
jgi:hypothetical protein